MTIARSLGLVSLWTSQNRFYPDAVAAPRANTQVNGKYYIHTTRRDYACFGSGGSSATTTEARDASRTTLSAPSPSSGSRSAFA